MQLCSKLPFALSACWIVLLSSMSPLFAADADRERLREIGAVLKENKLEITDLQIDCTELTDAHYQLIGSVTTLTSLSISGKPMSDDQLALLTGLTELQSIMLNGTSLTDEGYRHFTQFTKLRSLALFHPSRDCPGFTGAGLAHLKGLEKLERLTFAGATAGDTALEAIGKLTQLQEFRAWHNWESADGLRHLLALKGLKSLTLGQRLTRRGADATPSLDDAAMNVISQMHSLERLSLQEARLSGTALAKLKSLPNLKQLTLKLVAISQAEIDRLQSELPNAKLDWHPLTPEEDEATLVKKLKL